VERWKGLAVESKGKPWWQYINLLGLDAPLVAVLWLFLFAKTWRVNYHPWEAYVALGLIAWTVRIVVKLLESVMADDKTTFQMVHRKGLRLIAVLAGITALILTVLNFPLSGYNYLFVGLILVVSYIALTLFSSPEHGEIPYGKHAVGGIAFAFGTALMAHAYLPSLEIKELLYSREFICFALLCLIASAAVDLWSRTSRDGETESRVQDEIALSLPLTLLGAASLIFAVQTESMIARPFFYGILTGAALLQVLNRMHHRFTFDNVKVLTSVCLLIPGIIFQAYEMSR